MAIVGPTGAGKTTLVNLIMRFYELDAGRITLDGVDIATVPRPLLREQIGMVLQDTWLFHGTIRDNIAYGRPDASEAEIQAAAEATYVDRFVHSLPDGYDTVIDEEGSNISAGEKQLITIARAFLADPALLILDEATSSVDTRTEVLVQRAMAALRSDRTSFVIAHRLSTIRDADVILVMEQGADRRAGQPPRAAGGPRRLLRALQLPVRRRHRGTGGRPGSGPRRCPRRQRGASQLTHAERSAQTYASRAFKVAWLKPMLKAARVCIGMVPITLISSGSCSRGGVPLLVSRAPAALVGQPLVQGRVAVQRSLPRRRVDGDHLAQRQIAGGRCRRRSRTRRSPPPSRRPGSTSTRRPARPVRCRPTRSRRAPGTPWRSPSALGRAGRRWTPESPT